MPLLLVCVEGSASDADAEACRDRFGELIDRQWTYQPEFVDQVDEMPVTDPDDLPVVRTVGVVMPLPEPDDPEDEPAVRRDVEALVRNVWEFGRQEAIDFVIEYREEEVGYLNERDDADHFLKGFFGDDG